MLNTKHRILWSDTGIQSYRDLLGPTLLSLSENWSDPQSSVSFSVLLQSNNSALTAAAKASNKVTDLSKPMKPKISSIPLEVSAAAKEISDFHQTLQKVNLDPLSSNFMKSSAKLDFSNSRTKHRRLWRRHQASLAAISSSKTDDILTNPSKAFNHLRSMKSPQLSKISELKVGNETFVGDDVADGLFTNINALKTMKPETKNCKECETIKFDYDLIKQISQAGQQIPDLEIVVDPGILQVTKWGWQKLFGHIHTILL